jgi:hypothetical protein
MLFKLLAAFLCGISASHLWQTAEGWRKSGVIPAECNEDEGLPIPEGGVGFSASIFWMKSLSVLAAVFAFLAGGSFLVDCVRYL